MEVCLEGLASKGGAEALMYVCSEGGGCIMAGDGGCNDMMAALEAGWCWFGRGGCFGGDGLIGVGEGRCWAD